MDKVLYYLVTFLESTLSVVGIRAAFEEPRYMVVERLKRGAEIRAYEVRVAVETATKGEQDGERSGGCSATSPARTAAATASP